MTFYKMPTREQAEAELKKQNVRFTLAQVVAMIEDGTITAHLPPVKTGFCDWCRAYGLTRETSGPQVIAFCHECEPLGLAMLKAIYYVDAEAYLGLQVRLSERQEMANEIVH